ncbi:cysteine hydrolase family protein [uncultured Pseudodesulfovibrio sp.]|uniref:cysteine hydrolase family protein n=1 Tax=uncultured Pseudodesulfovibrio sp. TaxID=2035858 RepID=UPI0029C61505|nr:cysteine hydrolase family protein [uncultured Pseudodesulfovibrio sp.]
MSRKTALVVVDVQRVMFETPGEVLHEGRRVLQTIAGLIASARKNDVPVVYIQHTTEGAGSEFEKDSHGWLIAEDIAPQDGDTISLKYTYDAFCNTQLHEKLTGIGATDLVFCGLQTEVCVDTTIRSALAHGYTSTLAEDGHSTYDNGVLSAKDIIAHHNQTLNRRFCKVVPASDITF